MLGRNIPATAKSYSNLIRAYLLRTLLDVAFKGKSCGG
jgi:hypothetical protein